MTLFKLSRKLLQPEVTFQGYDYLLNYHKLSCKSVTKVRSSKQIEDVADKMSGFKLLL